MDYLAVDDTLYKPFIKQMFIKKLLKLQLIFIVLCKWFEHTVYDIWKGIRKLQLMFINLNINKKMFYETFHCVLTVK